MKDFEREALLCYANTNGFRKKIAVSKRIVRSALDTAGPWYCSVSGGKDSTVVHDLVRLEQPGAISLWSDEEYFLPETKEYIDRLTASGSNILRIRGAIKHTEWFTSNEGSEELGKTAWAIQNGYQGVFLGLRAEENKKRRLYLANFGELHFAKNRGLWLCNPIAWWKVEDVWAYLLSRGLDYNRAYDKLSDLGIDLKHQRIGPFATEEVLGYGQLAVLRMGWPEQYARFAKKHPQAAQYT